MRDWPGQGRSGSQPRGDGGRGWNGDPGRWRLRDGEGDRSETETPRPKGRTTRRNTVPRCETAAARMETGNAGARGQTEPTIPVTISSPCSQPSQPPPEQDAVSMTTWPARKGGRGLQRKFSTAGREEGVKQRRKWPIQWGSRKASATPNHCAHCPQDCHPHPHRGNLHPHLWPPAGKRESLREAQGSNVQRSATAKAWCVRVGRPAGDGCLDCRPPDSRTWPWTGSRRGWG